jgi:hypothetical protein
MRGMRLLRLRFTIGQLMVVVAVTAVYLGLHGPPSAVEATHLVVGSIAAGVLACLLGLLFRNRRLDRDSEKPRNGLPEELAKRGRAQARVTSDP